MDSDRLDPILPPELEENIFAYAVRGDVDSVRTHVLVARRVRHWVLNVAFEVVIMHPDRGYPKKTTLDDLKRYGHRVRHLMIHWTTPPDSDSSVSVNDCLTLCPYVENLALWVGSYNDDTFQKISYLPLKRLSMDLTWLSMTSTWTPLLTFFSRITHLDIVNIMLTWSECEFLVHFRALTHLALNSHTWSEVLEAILREVRGLEVIVWLSESRSSIAEKELPRGIQDERVVGVVCDTRRDWESGIRSSGKKDMWDFAECIVRDRKAIS